MVKIAKLRFGSSKEGYHYGICGDSSKRVVSVTWDDQTFSSVHRVDLEEVSVTEFDAEKAADPLPFYYENTDGDSDATEAYEGDVEGENPKFGFDFDTDFLQVGLECTN